jgi:hypothetical protein
MADARQTPREFLSGHGVTLASYSAGTHGSTCPKCSHLRKPAHRHYTCLAVTISDDEKSAVLFCHNCGWATGTGKGNGADHAERPFHIYRDRDGVILCRKVKNWPGKEPRFFWQHPNGAGWAKGHGDADLTIIYRADEVAKAIAEGRVNPDRRGRKGR